ncbi:Ion channel [Dictyocaulus viviparus]|uniref:Ion channel n=1 Tax=Dictyocaulus viviparus TaxID=29172 RepID=A0A0D8XN64_DICVI|nr:Ion channel [Dictyocaulus viviparus]
MHLCDLILSRQWPFMTTGQEQMSNVSVTGYDNTAAYHYWTLMDSVLFCFTVITTIGYGNVAPRTFNGRLFVILYGLIGIPFTMLAIANLGKFLATVLRSWTRPFVLGVRISIKKSNPFAGYTATPHVAAKQYRCNLMNTVTTATLFIIHD